MKKHLKLIHIATGPKMFTQFRMPMIRMQRDTYKNLVLYFPNSDNKLERKLYLNGFKMVNGPVTNRISPYTIFEIVILYKFLIKNNFDILVAHQPIGSIIGIIAGLLAGVPVRIYSTGGLKWMPGRVGIHNQLMKLGEQLIIKMSSAVFLVNKEDEAVMKSNTMKSKFFYVGPRGGCGVNPEKFSMSVRLKYRKKVRKELKIEEDVIVVGYAGRIVWEKGLKEIIELASIVKNEKNINNFVFVFLGVGKDVLEFKKALNGINVLNNFIFLGYVENVEYFMSAFDIFLLPSYREGLPVALLEAMALTIPCIATNIRGSRDLITNKKTGLLVPIKDANKISAALFQYCDNKSIRDSIGLSGANYVRKEYSEKQLLYKMNNVIENLESQNLYLPQRVNIRLKRGML